MTKCEAKKMFNEYGDVPGMKIVKREGRYMISYPYSGDGSTHYFEKDDESHFCEYDEEGTLLVRCPI